MEVKKESKLNHYNYSDDVTYNRRLTKINTSIAPEEPNTNKINH